MTIDTSDKTKCCGCGACVVACPQSCIRLVPDEEGFEYPVIDLQACVDCGECLSVCGMQSPVAARKVEATYAGWHTSPTIRAKGTSGSVFSALAEAVFRSGGFVVGAAFAPDFKSVRHQIADSMPLVEPFLGSKYVQSETDGCFGEIVKVLNTGQSVFYAGTPCQVASLRHLVKNHRLLITCDIVCHGVPSPAVYKRYITELETHRGATIVKHAFRDKTCGWNFPRILSIFNDGRTRWRLPWTDLYSYGFYANVFLRPCCYVCPFATADRVGDLTLADCWRLAASHPQYDDNQGTSLVLENSEKGHELLRKASQGGWLFLGDYDFGLACSRNAPLCAPATMSTAREAFFKVFVETQSFAQASKVYAKRGFMMRKRVEQGIKRLLWPILRRFQ